MTNGLFSGLAKKILFWRKMLPVILSGNNRPSAILRSALGQRIFCRPIFDSGGKAAHPGLVIILATFRCNLRCQHCSLHRHSGYFCRENTAELKAQELPFAVIKRLIDEIAEFSPMIVLTGGEIFLREDAASLIEYVKSKKLFATVITNGTLLNAEIIHRLIDCKLDKLVCSIDGLQEIHDDLRGGQEVFNQVIANLRLFSRIKKTKRAPYPLLQINHTLFEQNYLKMIPFAEYLNGSSEVAVDILNFIHPVFLEQEAVDRHKDYIRMHFGIDSDILGGVTDINIEAQKLHRETEAIIKGSKKWKFIVQFHPDLHGREGDYYSPGYLPREKNCLHASQQVTVLADGRTGCCSGVAFGNIKDLSFQEIWDSQNARFFRQTLGKGLLPYCKRCCYLNH
jgi:MoaA/NifB/PqqE/SkfB family radical SAM enzyme